MSENQDDLKGSSEIKLQRWLKMLGGDTEALIEIIIERGMATKDDFKEEYNLNKR